MRTARALAAVTALLLAPAALAQIVTLSCDSDDAQIRRMYPGDTIFDIDVGNRTWREVRGGRLCSGQATITERNYLLDVSPPCSAGRFQIDRSTGDFYYCAPNEARCSRTMICKRLEQRL